ncbi:DUF2516 family protein [Pseudonocardia ailaonensis]|uniref:DUF2516 family protein n=1 Tax=Pseudonocardia ailaonensis TaxID=367279 RepID=A0ABN2NJ35_9PSEU
MNWLANLDLLVMAVIGIVVAAYSGYAFVHAIRQRADAFQAASKLTKNAWLGITGAAALFLLIIPIFGVISSPSLVGVVFSFQGLRSELTLFWLAGTVAMIVYLVDVKPAVVAASRGGNSW